MEAKHTKEQWTLENMTGRTLRVTAGAKGFVIAEVTNDCITHFIGNTDEALANAKLIASAPDLLKSLQFAVKFIRQCPKLREEDQPRGLEKWEEIIKKATE